MEGTNNSIWDQAKKIDLVDYLESLGYQPKVVRNQDYWYLSPFRKENTPSFKVNRQKNVWFDHGSGEGGTIIDFGVKLFGWTYHEVIEKLPYGNLSHRNTLETRQSKNTATSSKIEIASTTVLQDSHLIDYLKSRAIGIELARQYCVEVDFKIGERTYKAIGFQNRAGAYELRNKWFKGASSPKDLTFIERGSKKLCVLEGFLDFLSLHQIPEFRNQAADANFLVLNSVSFVNRSLPFIEPHGEINLFLDNDLAGRNAKLILNQKGIRFHDASTFYGIHKDVNEYLMSQSKNKQGKSLPKSRSRRMRR